MEYGKIMGYIQQKEDEIKINLTKNCGL